MPPQHLSALALANQTRLSRAELKRAIKAREVLACEVLSSEIPDWLENMPVEELLLAIPRLQWRFYQGLMVQTNTGLFATVGALTERKRNEIAQLLADWEARVPEPRRARRHLASTDHARRRAA